MKFLKHKIFGALALMFFGAGGLSAQENGVELGIFTLYPTIGLTVGYDDNVALSNDRPVSSTFYVLAPAVRLQTGTAQSQFTVDYNINRGDYLDSDRDSYTDHRLGASWVYDPTARTDLEIRAAWERGHDRRGEGLREEFAGTLDLDVDEFDDQSIGIRYQYGAVGARGRLALFADLADRSYRSNREFTVTGSNESLRYGGELGYRVAPKTILLAQANWQDVDYDVSDRDGDLKQFAVGVQWEGSSKTDGRVLVGRMRKDFDSPGLASYSGAFWEVGASWRPVERSELAIQGRRSTDETFGASNFLLREDISLSWRHVWRPRFVTSVDLGAMDEDFRPGPRQDDLLRYGVSAEYQFRRWLIFGAGLQHVDRDSNLPQFNYARNELLFSVQLNL